MIPFIILLLIILVGFPLYRTRQVQTSPNQKFFLAGKTPQPKPEGFYHGQVTGYSGSWQGKTFDPKEQTGLNVFKERGREMKKYPFKTYIAKGLVDNQDVLKIDYNLKENPFWVRLITDEIVQIAPHSYLGKIIIRTIPGLPFPLGFFRLSK